MFYLNLEWKGREYQDLLMQRLDWAIYEIIEIKVRYKRYIVFTLAGCHFSDMCEDCALALHQLYLDIYVILVSINRVDLFSWYLNQVDWPVSDFVCY